MHHCVLQRIKNFHISKQLQIETLTFLVNSQAFELKQLRHEFRNLDTENTGTLKLAQIRKAFEGANMSD